MTTVAPAPAQTGPKSFAYRSRSNTGQLVKGIIDAANEQGVVARLRAQGLTPIEITEKVAGTGLQKEISFGGAKPIKLKHLAIACRQLATMTASGLSLLRALTTVAEQTENKQLKQLLSEVSREVETGTAFSDALSKHPRDIPPLMSSMLRAGEQGGFLDVALDAIATTFEKEVKLRATIKSAMTYPIVVLGIAALAVLGMLLFVVPIFKKLFAGFHHSLPAPTQILVTLSDQMVWVLPTIIVVSIAGTLWWRAKKNSDNVRKVLHPLMLRVPIFGPLMGKVAISRFARNLANMTSAGVPLMRALGIVGPTSGNWVVEKTVERIAESVRVGKSMSAPIAEEKMFPKMVVQMIAVGEESGSIDAMLGKVADFYDEEIEATADAMTSLIEPILICVLGVVVGGMIVALYMPIFTLATVIH